MRRQVLALSVMSAMIATAPSYAQQSDPLRDALSDWQGMTGAAAALQSAIQHADKSYGSILSTLRSIQEQSAKNAGDAQFWQDACQSTKECRMGEPAIAAAPAASPGSASVQPTTAPPAPAPADMAPTAEPLPAQPPVQSRPLQLPDKMRH